jgi:hypothetical protein
VVERQLPKLNVASSILVSRSKKINQKSCAWSMVQFWSTFLSALRNCLPIASVSPTSVAIALCPDWRTTMIGAEWIRSRIKRRSNSRWFWECHPATLLLRQFVANLTIADPQKQKLTPSILGCSALEFLTYRTSLSTAPLKMWRSWDLVPIADRRGDVSGATSIDQISRQQPVTSNRFHHIRRETLRSI